MTNVSELKRKLHRKLGIPAEGQILMHTQFGLFEHDSRVMELGSLAKYRLYDGNKILQFVFFRLSRYSQFSGASVYLFERLKDNDTFKVLAGDGKTYMIPVSSGLLFHSYLPH